MIYVMLLTLLVVMVGIFGCLAYLIYRDSSIRKMQFEIQMKASDAQASMKENMSFNEMIEIINGIVLRESATHVIQGGYSSKTEDELSLIIDDLITAVSTAVRLDMGPELIRQWNKYSNEDYLMKFIIEMSRTAIVLRIERFRKETVESPRVLIPKKEPKKK